MESAFLAYGNEAPGRALTGLGAHSAEGLPFSRRNVLARGRIGNFAAQEVVDSPIGAPPRDKVLEIMRP